MCWCFNGGLRSYKRKKNFCDNSVIFIFFYSFIHPSVVVVKVYEVIKKILFDTCERIYCVGQKLYKREKQKRERKIKKSSRIKKKIWNSNTILTKKIKIK